MLKTKRDLPPALQDADARTEQWRAKLLRALDPRLDIAIYQLVVAAGINVAALAQRLMPGAASDYEIAARAKLAGLQFALEGLDGPLPEEPFVQDLVDQSLKLDDLERAVRIIDQVSAYAQVRDAVLTYAWGGYEILIPRKNVLRFVDPPDWRGARDYAEMVIGQEIKLELAKSLRPVLAAPVEWILQGAVDFPRTLPLGELTTAQFISAWVGLSSAVAPHWITGSTPVVEEAALIAQIQGITGLSGEEAKRFVELVTFDRKERRLTLCHCPLMPVTATSRAIIAAGVILGNPIAVIPRLAALRGPGVYADEVETHLLERLKEQFEVEGVRVETRIPYVCGDDQGDVDLVVYETTANRLLVGQVKAFIPPDTVEEVVRANAALQEAMDQLRRVQRWLGTLAPTKWGRVLRIPLSGEPARVQFAVIGNGFAGSDYLAIPESVVMVNAHYLLLPRFCGKSAFDALDAFQERLVNEASRATSSKKNVLSFTLGDLQFDVPGWERFV